MIKKVVVPIYLFSSLFILILTLTAWINGGMFPAIFYLMVMAIGIIIGVVGLRLRTQAFEARGIHLFLVFFLLIYTVCESFVNFIIITKRESVEIPIQDLGFGAFNGPCADYDNIRGFRWNGEAPRISKIINNHVVYDHYFHLNEQGFYFDIDFKKIKSDSLSKRLIVLGDSFTSGEYLEKPWPVRFNELSGSDKKLYSFSVNGGGLFNWYSIFFNEIVSHYEFDGIILPVFGNDLQRDFFVMDHGPEVGLTGYLDTIPSSWQDVQDYFSEQLKPYATYMTDSLINQKKDEAIRFSEQQFRFAPDIYLFALAISTPVRMSQDNKFKKFLQDQIIDESITNDHELIERELGTDKLRMMEEIIHYCEVNEKEMIIATLPYEPGYQYLDKGQEFKHAAVCKAICRRYDLLFFDGVAIYDDLDKKSLSECFLPFDVHWSQKGSDVFAREFHAFMKDRH